MNRIAVIVLMLSVAAAAQTPTPVAMTQNEQTAMANAWLTLENAQLRLQLTAREVEKAHPGSQYDFNTRELVLTPTPPAPAKVQPTIPGAQPPVSPKK